MENQGKMALMVDILTRWLFAIHQKNMEIRLNMVDLYSVEGVNATSPQLMFLAMSLHFPVITNEPVVKLKIIVPQHMSI